MVRLLGEGILIGWGVWAMWLLLPVPGTLLGMFLWYVFRYLLDCRYPMSRRLREAREEANREIHALKAKVLDANLERDAARADAERYLGQINQVTGVVGGFPKDC